MIQIRAVQNQTGHYSGKQLRRLHAYCCTVQAYNCNCKYNSSKHVAIQVDVALRYRVSSYLCVTDPSIGSHAFHVTDFPPPSPVLEPHTQATPNVTGFHQLLNFTSNSRQLDGKNCHRGRTYFVKDRLSQFKRSTSQKLLYVSRSNFQGILRLPRSFNFKRPVHMIPGVSKRKSFAYFDSRYILTLIDIRVACTKVSPRFDNKAGELCNIFPESGLVWL